MIKSVVFFVFCCWFSNSSLGQLHDKHWYTGSNSDVGFDTSFNYWFGITKFSFTPTDTPVITRDSLGINFDRCNITMSDSAGNVLFYTNGVTFRNAQDQIMQNGDSLGWGWYFKNYDPSRLRLGLRNPISSFCYPDKEDGVFNYVYLNLDSFSTTIRYRNFYWARVNSNNNIIEFKDSILNSKITSSLLAATKGDSDYSWWTAYYIDNTSCFYIQKIDSNANVSGEEQCFSNLSPPSNINYLTNNIFTNDGKTFVSATGGYNNTGTLGYANVKVFDFDRCTGKLYFKNRFDVSMMADSLWIPWGIANSPNSRYLYLFCSAAILQFDLEAANIENSMVKVAQWDGFTDFVPVTMYQGQLAIDGKIYVSSGNGVTYIGVIENPDVGGIGCNVKQHSIRVPTFITGLNHFPNYRLGAANCTGVGINEAAISKVRMGLYPNPASSTLQVEYNYINWEQSGSIQLILTDATGRSIHSQALPMYSGLQNVDVTQLAGGVYFVSLNANGRTIANAKFVKE